MAVVITLFISLSLTFVGASSSSIGSEFESSLSCSKFHFEEKVLEKLVRLEHKMQILEEKMDAREKLNTAKLDEISNIMDAREKLNTAKLDEINNIKKQTETFVQSVKDTQIQDQTRFNKSYQEIVEHFNTKATNETDIYGHQINTLLESFSSKIEVFTEAEKKRESVTELMQINLDREQKRFNSSYDQIVEYFKESSKKTLLELIVNQQKGRIYLSKYSIIIGFCPSSKVFVHCEVSNDKRINLRVYRNDGKKEAVAFSAYRSRSQTLSYGSIVVFDGVWTNVGNGYEPSTGIFTALYPGLYHLTAVVVSSSGNSLMLYLRHNGSRLTRSYQTGDGYKTGTFDVVLNLQKGDKVYIDSQSIQTIYSDSTKFITFSGYRIT
ncbi:C1QL [Mytilus edulis]|uniref:C1QL n=1 Tax=Mytilus edulis TaxID=6550 RepID=A0A8S3QDQ7_MYTED|nr:C1QL [Mytilus edulis]